jgi:hypothetical protein
LGACPQRTNRPANALLFQEKEAKSISSASQKTAKALVPLRRRQFGYPNLGEADPGGLGACPQRTNGPANILLFQEKEAKSISSASQKTV